MEKGSPNRWLVVCRDPKGHMSDAHTFKAEPQVDG